MTEVRAAAEERGGEGCRVWKGVRAVGIRFPRAATFLSFLQDGLAF